MDQAYMLICRVSQLKYMRVTRRIVLTLSQKQSRSLAVLKKSLVVFKILDLATLLFYCVALRQFCMKICLILDFTIFFMIFLFWLIRSQNRAFSLMCHTILTFFITQWPSTTTAPERSKRKYHITMSLSRCSRDQSPYNIF